MTPFLVLLLLVAVIVALVYRFRLRRQQRQQAAMHAQMLASLQAQQQQMAAMAAELDRLSVYRGLADAEAQAELVLNQTQAHLKKSTAEAEQIVSSARRNAEEVSGRILQSARQYHDDTEAQANAALQQARQNATQTVDEARRRSNQIIEEADRKAEEVAGDALSAKANLKTYEKAAEALKNVVEGYGDRYLVPAHSLLDDLAEEFGFAQAGEELKRARQRTRDMITSRRAATCDYVEENRRLTAIDFVVDAFNGKVDMALAKVKDDNAGKLAQEIRDAYALVNLNGRAFRNARVEADYLNARLAELKWAAAANLLKLQEREEQRRIKEKLREEQKARKEFERAIRDANKEEETLRKAMEKAMGQMEKASSEQRAKYEAQLEELNRRLKEAEERNQRALSMAQQTRCGHVYVISNIGSFGENVYKVGLTRRLDPQDRVKELGDASVPFRFDVHAMIYSEDAPALEHRLHRLLVTNQLNKVNPRKEFFRADLAQIRAEVEAQGLKNVHWTLTAEAQEYRETLAMEKAMRDDPAKRDAWVKQQLEMQLKMPDEEELDAELLEEA